MSQRERTAVAAFRHYLREKNKLLEAIKRARELYVEPIRRQAIGVSRDRDMRKAARLELALSYVTPDGALTAATRVASSFSDVRTSNDVPDALPAILHTWLGGLVDSLFADVETLLVAVESAASSADGGYPLKRARDEWREGDCTFAYWELPHVDRPEVVAHFLLAAQGLAYLDESARDRLRVYASHGEEPPSSRRPFSLTSIPA